MPIDGGRNGLNLGCGIKMRISPILMLGLEYQQARYKNNKGRWGFLLKKTHVHNFNLNLSLVL